MLSAAAFARRFTEVEFLKLGFIRFADRLAVRRIEELIHCFDKLHFFLHRQVQKAMEYYRSVFGHSDLQVPVCKDLSSERTV